MAWICFNDAFLSIVEVQDDKSKLLVRARKEGHIEAVFPGATVEKTIGRDYLWRAKIKREDVAQAVSERLTNIDYGNFKNSVVDHKLHSVYGKIWGAMSTIQEIMPYAFKGIYQDLLVEKGIHPKKNDKGHIVEIQEPNRGTPFENWRFNDSEVTITPGALVPLELNGIKFQAWKEYPKTASEWNAVSGQCEVNEPPIHHVSGKYLSAGVIVEEPDDRIWMVSPTNAFGGYINTFPKGRIEDSINPQASAIKEAFEESGLKVEIIGFVADVEKPTSVTRYYRARRVGGTPADMGWESQAVHLVPRDMVRDFINCNYDLPLLEHIESD